MAKALFGHTPVMSNRLFLEIETLQRKMRSLEAENDRLRVENEALSTMVGEQVAADALAQHFVLDVSRR